MRLLRLYARMQIRGTVCKSSESETVKTRVILPLLYGARIQTGCISCNMSRGQNFAAAKKKKFRENRNVTNCRCKIKVLALGPCNMSLSVCKPCRNSEKEYLFLWHRHHSHPWESPLLCKEINYATQVAWKTLGYFSSNQEQWRI